MIDFLYRRLTDPQSLLGLLTAIATVATILTLAMPILETDKLADRMRAVATERERIRTRERERLQAEKGKISVRQQPKVYMKQVVERFSLSKWLGTDKAKLQMAMAGFRGPQAEVGFLFFRLVTPAVSLTLSSFYLTVVSDFGLSGFLQIGVILFMTYTGLKLPELYLRNTISKRQFSMTRAFPDALDLLLICVESGMSSEHAFRKVSQEIGVQSVPLAEELTLTTAELSYLPDRRTAYENLGLRTGLEAIKQVVTVLIQSERYGTPLGAALRVVCKESRDNRMMLAEKKAAALPPKLTVPMILFFLPVLFAVIMTPAAIQISRTWH
ncbi:MAG TPA: type II secretion system F family protein [Methylocella sp.]|nr:type II secretion system F family protein [Methylocella sp.]